MIWFAHSRELCEQAYETFKNSWQAKGDYPIQMFKVFGSNTPNIDGVENGIFFIGLQKFNSVINRNHPIAIRLREYTRLVIVDEAHKSVATTYNNSIKYLLAPDTRLFGLTATPGKSDYGNNKGTQQLSSFYNKNKINICDELGNDLDDAIKNLQDNRYLARLKRIKIDSEVEFADAEIDKIYKGVNESKDKFPSDILSKLSTNNIRNSKIVYEIDL